MAMPLATIKISMVNKNSGQDSCHHTPYSVKLIVLVTCAEISCPQ